MQYILESDKTIEQVCEDLSKAVTKHGFGVLHIHNLKETMNNKGVEFEQECRIFEVCNPHKAKAVLDWDMSMNMMLPCRISVYTESGKTKIGMLKPTALIKYLATAPSLIAIAQEVENLTTAMIKDAV